MLLNSLSEEYFVAPDNFIGFKVRTIKGIVSQDFEWLQIILMNRLCVPDVPLEVYFFDIFIQFFNFLIYSF